MCNMIYFILYKLKIIIYEERRENKIQENSGPYPGDRFTVGFKNNQNRKIS